MRQNTLLEDTFYIYRFQLVSVAQQTGLSSVSRVKKMFFSFTGILGPITSWTTKPVAEMAGHFPASQISPSASSPALSDKAKYPYFLRTGLSSSDQIEVHCL